MIWRRGWVVLCALAGACDSGSERAAEAGLPALHAVPNAAEHARLEEWFPFAGVRCRAVHLHQQLAELAARRSDVRVKRDVRTLAVSLECERPGRGAVDAESVLAQGVAVTLLGPDGRVHPARLRNRGEREADTSAPETRAALIFELDPRAPLASARRVYDARDGTARGGAHAADYTLSLARERERVDTLLRYRFEGTELDRMLARIVAALARGTGLSQLGTASAAPRLADVQRAYATLAQRYAPRVLRVEVEPAADDTIAVQLWPMELTRRTHPAEPLRVGLTLAQKGAGYQLVDADNPSALARAVRCAALDEGLADALRDTSDGSATTDASCSVLGIRLPFPCDDVPVRIRAQAVDVGEECNGTSLPTAAPKTAPEDFQLVLRHARNAHRRGRSVGRDTRSTLVIFGNANVVFHGQQHDGTTDARRDGRTTKEWVARLYGAIDALHWFERRGGNFDRDRCGPSAPEGDVITVVADGHERMVLHRDGCRGPFSADELDALVQHALAVGGARGFTAVRPSYHDPHVRVWTVAAD